MLDVAWTPLYLLLIWEEYLPVESKEHTLYYIILYYTIYYSNTDNKIGLNRRETFIMQMKKKLLSKVCILYVITIIIL